MQCSRLEYRDRFDGGKSSHVCLSVNFWTSALQKIEVMTLITTCVLLLYTAQEHYVPLKNRILAANVSPLRWREEIQRFLRWTKRHPRHAPDSKTGRDSNISGTLARRIIVRSMYSNQHRNVDISKIPTNRRELLSTLPRSKF